MENHGGMMLTGKIEELGEKPVPFSLCLPQIPHELSRPRTRALSSHDYSLRRADVRKLLVCLSVHLNTYRTAVVVIPSLH
jgi:hypothetical protein